MTRHGRLCAPGSRWRPALLALVMVALPALASAAELYQWKDASGMMHYTDNPDAVPAQYRNQSQRQVTPLAGIKPQAGDNAVDDVDADVGRKVWDSKCKACHVYDSDVRTDEGQTKGLFSFIINPATKFPYPEATVVNTLRKAVRGGFEDMPAVAVSDTQLKALAQFLIKEASSP